MLGEDFEKADATCRKVFSDIATTHTYEFEVQRYSSSLQRLVVSLTPINSDGSLGLNQRKFLLFVGVQHLQLPTHWRSGPLQWMPLEQRADFLRSLELAANDNWLSRVAYMETERLKISIVFTDVELSDSFPRIKGEYSFPEHRILGE